MNNNKDKSYIYIYIWGTGNACELMLNDGFPLEKIEGFIESEPKVESYMGKKVFRPEEIIEHGYDLIIVANLFAEEIYDKCRELNIDQRKLYFIRNTSYLPHNVMWNDPDNSASDSIREVIAAVESNKLLNYSQSCLKIKEKIYQKDFIRYKTLELCLQEIKDRNIEGSVAELGVYRGDFSRYINYLLPDRKLFLFDTFEGFDETEAQKEYSAGRANKLFCQRFKDTSVDYVVNRMINKDNIVVRKGLFPATSENLENEKFAFVSIDVDFEDSIYNGLCFFYPKLADGGYIFIHEYNQFPLVGVKIAVNRYEKEHNIKLIRVPVADVHGTLIITK